MRRAVLVVLGALTAVTAFAQEAAAPPEGWTRALSSDQKHYVWSNLDLEGQGCELAFYTDGWAIKIHTSRFLNVNSTTEEKALKLDDPPKPKKPKRR